MRSRWTCTRYAYLAGGIGVWLAAAVCVTLWVSTRHGSTTPLGRVFDFAAGEPRSIDVELPVGRLSPGARVFHLREGKLYSCGEVVRVEGPVGGATVTLALYPDAGLPDPLPPTTRLTLFDARGTLEWAIGRVLSSDRRHRVVAAVRAMVAEHEEALREAFGPVLQEFAQGMVGDIVAELARFLRTHHEELRDVGGDVLERARARWEPLLREILWPRVIDRLRPMAQQLGSELWNELPWGEIASTVAQAFGGAVVNVLLPSQYELPTDQVHRWRDRYLAETAIPKLGSYLPAALDAVGEVLAEAAEDERIRQALRDTLFEDGLGDPKVVGIVAKAFSAAVPGNQRLRARVRALLDDLRIRRALYDFAERLEPRLVALARTLLLDETTGALHPELAMLVRVRLLGSEKDWLLLELAPTDGGATTAASGTQPGRSNRLWIQLYTGSRIDLWEKPRP